jgi:AraC family transcriptional regulator
MDRRVFTLRKFINENLEQEFSVEQLAGQVKLSVSHLSTVFRKEIGVPPIRYIINLRLEESAKFLEHEDFMSVKQIGMRVGFNDQSRFVREFKKKYALTPKQYRNQKWAEQEIQYKVTNN